MPQVVDSKGKTTYVQSTSSGTISNRIQVQSPTMTAANTEIYVKRQALRDAANSATLVLRGNLKINIHDRVSIIIKRKDGETHFTSGTYLVKSKNDLIEGAFTSTYELVKISSTLNYQGTEDINVQDPQVEGDEVLPTTVTGTELGIAIAEYARQYAGKLRYVWGGTSLETGADCSGFTMRIYEHFGIQLPHSSTEQGKYGIEVQASDLQPGDLVVYVPKWSSKYNRNVGHVAISLGGGAIVHAASSKTGVKTDARYNYRPVQTIRRFV